jgi:eukaryotic-like serine/threonine-protein kinase
MNLPLNNSAELNLSATVLGHYQLRGRLGEGGFGEVFEAWDNKLHRLVAIKRLKNLSTGHSSESLIKEARLAASLQHAAFVKIHAVEEDGDSPSIVMELVPGMTLKEWIKTQAIDEKKALDIVQQIAAAMHEAHASGLIHGDLKPSNLIIEPSGKVRILDFGLASKGDAQATASLIQTDTQGTIAYMAPERLLGNPPSKQSDIYALGTILYELVSGVRPFETLSGLALAAAHMQTSSAQWRYADTISPSAVSLIRAMTLREVKERLASMKDICNRIEGLRLVKGVQLQKVLPKFEHWAEMRKGLLSATISGLLFIFVGWLLASYFPQIQTAITPFSASLAMNDGFNALKLFDRPGSLDIATTNFTAILERDPENAAAVAGLSLVFSNRYLSDKQDDTWLKKANASAQQALKLNDQLALSHIANGWFLALDGKREAAILSYEKALIFDPNNFFAQYGKVQSLRMLRRYEEATQAAELGTQLYPKERVFVDELGTIYYDQADYVSAERAFRRSIELQPDAIFSYANLNATLLRLGKSDEALQVLQQGLQIRPNARLYGNLGNALFVRGDYLGAVAAFENAISPKVGNPENYLGWANLADALLWIPGRNEQAIKAFEKAQALLSPRLARSPDDVTLVSRMALYMARLNDKVNAETLILHAKKLAPNSADVAFRAGLAYELLGNRKAALEQINKAKLLGYPVKLINAEPALVSLRRDDAYIQSNLQP